MSIIHDALKKVQQQSGQAPKADETPNAGQAGYIYAAPAAGPAKQAAPEIVEHLQPKQNKAKSVLALLCAIAFAVGCYVFLYKQLHTYFPQLERSAKSSFYKWIHKKEEPDFKTKAPRDLVPLAKITVIPPQPASPPNSTNPSAIYNMAKPEAPLTLNIHGVMSNGSSNLVLINDQVYQEGDTVDGIKIVTISLNSLKVINNGKEETIRVKQ